jgi:hypothetical protein
MNKFLRISFFEREQNYCEILKKYQISIKNKILTKNYNIH